MRLGKPARPNHTGTLAIKGHQQVAGGSRGWAADQENKGEGEW